MERRKTRALRTGAFASVILFALLTTAAPVQSGIHILPGVRPPPGGGLAIEMEGPVDVHAGFQYTVSVEIRNEDLTPKTITAIPFVDPDQSTDNACFVSSISVSTGEEDQDEYILMPSGDYSLRQLAEPFDQGELFEGSHALPMDYIRISVGVRTQEGLTGHCVTAVEVAEKDPLNEDSGPVTALLQSVKTDVIQAPSATIPLGLVLGVGGVEIDDGATYVGPAEVEASQIGKVKLIDDQNVELVTPLQKVPITWAGLYNQDDGSDIGDRLLVEITDNGARLKKATQAEKTADHSTISYDEELQATSGGKTYTRCLKGTYIDGGAWDDHEGSAEGCVTLTLKRVAPEAILHVVSIEEIDKLIWEQWMLHPGRAVGADSTEARLEAMQYVVLPLRNGTAVHLTRAALEFLKDPSP